MGEAEWVRVNRNVAIGVIGAGIGLAALVLSGVLPPVRAQAPRQGQLAAFSSDAELRAFLRRVAAQERYTSHNMVMPISPPPLVAVPAMEAAADSAQPPILTAPGITNTQEADVDEGGIVKLSGETLVILRRGRLFTVSIAGGGMRPIDSIDAFPPGVDASGDWYDEMLLSGDRVIVIGYSYARGGTEINRFRLAANGTLRFEDSHHLRSNDYYSSRNYASRLIGDRLVFYTPLYLNGGRDPLDSLPGLRRWQPGKVPGEFRRIAGAQQIFIPPVLRAARRANISTLHSVTNCDLASPVLRCSAMGVLGAESRTFYVSGKAVYLWVSDAWSRSPGRGRASAFLYRLPLNGTAPTAIAARGAPVDQFSFKEDGDTLRVLVRAESGGDAMWRPEMSEGSVALLEVSIASLGDGGREVPLTRYWSLPKPAGESWNFHNRFVGAHLLYGAGSYGGDTPGTLTVAKPVGRRIMQLPIGHMIDRIEPLGRDAMIVGQGRGALGFTAIDLPAGAPARRGATFLLPDAAEGETRSHAFFYSPYPDSRDGGAGLLGLPVARAATPAVQRFLGSSASMLFLRRSEGRLVPAGELAARPMQARDIDDGCTASCVDWYGNARPIFIGPRLFALLGAELVEGTRARGPVREITRIDFARTRGNVKRAE